MGREDGAQAAQALVQGLVGGGEEEGPVIHEVAACGCPVRAAPPPLPDSIPEYGGKRYPASAFNVCTHQALPGMAGPPLHLDVDPEAVPVASHVPAPVPLHWQKAVKEGIDGDVAMGVLEPILKN